VRLSLSYWILQAINYLTNLTGNYGWAIVILSVVLSLAIAPIQHMQIVNQSKTQEFDRLRKDIEKRYKGDKQRIQEETVRLMRSQKFSPLQGCLPMIIQMIFIFAFFGALRSLTYTEAPSFLWIKDLAKPDLFVLPALAGITTFLRSKLTTPTNADPAMQTQQRILLYGMPVFVAYMSLKFAAGLALYWVVANVVSILQQVFYPAGKQRGRKQPQPGQGEPKQAEPKRLELKPAAPRPAESGQPEPSQSAPKRTAPKQSKPKGPPPKPGQAEPKGSPPKSGSSKRARSRRKGTRS
jgi:YidC/Oxa1 family membrane protein insertase